MGNGKIISYRKQGELLKIIVAECVNDTILIVVECVNEKILTLAECVNEKITSRVWKDIHHSSM